MDIDDVDEIIHKMADSFQNKVDKEYTLTIQIKDQTFCVIARNGEVTVNERPCDQPHFILTTTPETLCKMWNGD